MKSREWRDGRVAVVTNAEATTGTVPEGSPVYGYRMVARIASYFTSPSAVPIWKMRWSITFSEIQTKQSDVFSIFSVICVRPFKQLINSTVTKLPKW